jgi:hypothetical protein
MMENQNSPRVLYQRAKDLQHNRVASLFATAGALIAPVGLELVFKLPSLARYEPANTPSNVGLQVAFGLFFLGLAGVSYWNARSVSKDADQTIRQLVRMAESNQQPSPMGN